MTSDEVKTYWERNAESWTKLARAGFDMYRDMHNTPAFFELLPPVAGLKGLDIGCGEGGNSRLLARRGAKVEAIDFVPAFIEHARAREAEEPLGVRYELGDAQALPYPDASFEFATAFMVLMDLPDPGRALKEAHRVLRPGGFFQFSIVHPCFAPPGRKVIRSGGRVRGIEVADYFVRLRGRVDSWHFGGVPKDERERIPPFQVPRFHHTLADWVNLIVGAGFTIRRLGEPMASKEDAARYPVLGDTRVAPLFLHFQLGKAL